MSDPKTAKPSSPVLLDYQHPGPAVGRRVTPAFIAVALAIVNTLWAAIAAYVWFGPLPAEVRSLGTLMLVCGLAPSTLIGTLVGVIAARGRWQWVGIVGNAGPLVMMAWLVMLLV